jgi:hypothetical protein
MTPMKPSDRAPAPPEPRGQKLPYSTPKLTIHGDLRTITAAKDGTRNDSGQPKTFNTGPK